MTFLVDSNRWCLTPRHPLPVPMHWQAVRCVQPEGAGNAWTCPYHESGSCPWYPGLCMCQCNQSNTLKAQGHPVHRGKASLLRVSAPSGQRLHYWALQCHLAASRDKVLPLQLPLVNPILDGAQQFRDTLDLIDYHRFRVNYPHLRRAGFRLQRQLLAQENLLNSYVSSTGVHMRPSYVQRFSCPASS